MRQLVMVVALVAGVAGCGGPSIAPARKAGAGAPAATPASPGRPRVARIVDFDYRPRTLHVHVGARVTWRNADIANHTVTFRADGPDPVANLKPGAGASRVFARAGRFPYVCEFHPSMRGTVIVAP